MKLPLFIVFLGLTIGISCPPALSAGTATISYSPVSISAAQRVNRFLTEGWGHYYAGNFRRALAAFNAAARLTRTDGRVIFARYYAKLAVTQGCDGVLALAVDYLLNSELNFHGGFDLAFEVASAGQLSCPRDSRFRDLIRYIIGEGMQPETLDIEKSEKRKAELHRLYRQP